MGANNFFVLILFLAVLRIQAQDCSKWVAPDGNDSTNDGSEADPYKTLFKAAQEIKKGDTQWVICLKEGSYPPDNITITFAGSLLIQAGQVGPDMPVLEGFTQVIEGNGNVTFSNVAVNRYVTSKPADILFFTHVRLDTAVIDAIVVIIQNATASSSTGSITITCAKFEISGSTFSGYTTKTIAAPLTVRTKRLDVRSTSFTNNVGQVTGGLYAKVTAGEAVYFLDNVRFEGTSATNPNDPSSASSLVIQSELPKDCTDCQPAGINITNSVFQCSGQNYPLVLIEPASWINQVNSNTSTYLNCNTTPTDCALGHYFRDPAFRCIPCLAGYHLDNRTMNYCTPCQPGFFSGQAAVNCTRCPQGYFSQHPERTICLPCNPGTASSNPSDTCPPCDINRFSDQYNQLTCTPCHDGQYTNGKGSTYCLGLTPMSWAFLAVAVVIFILIVVAIIGWMVWRNRRTTYQPIDG